MLVASWSATTDAAEILGSIIEAGYDKVYALNLADTGTDIDQKRRKISEYYDAHLARFQAPSALAGRASAEVDLLFRSAYLAGSYTFDAKYLSDMRRDIAALERRGVASQRSLSDFYHSLVAYRRFDEASSFLRAHPLTGVPPLPRVEDEVPDGYSGPSALYLVDASGGPILHRRASPLAVVSPQIVVVSHPNCHFSRNASDAIERSDVLLPIFQAHSTWITPQDGFIKITSLARWNQASKLPPTAVAYRQSEWPMFKNWATPTFYFFKGGKLVREVSGWPPEGNEEALKAAMREVGLLD
ncbi:hypothetical protein [Dyella amyloliquefaciens]|uniref:hypothetical protein n=1 Tax=Dyella amyloliquefaciens TaxID=1770545 RepID=UPI00102E653F|nr:hypothetical protein [Dyella amyloliquefaciens]